MARELAPRESCLPRGGGQPRVLSEKCATCILAPGDQAGLRPGRLKAMVGDATGEGTEGIICHETMTTGPYPDFGPALCRGFYDAYGHLNNFVRVMSRIGDGFLEVKPPDDPRGGPWGAVDGERDIEDEDYDEDDLDDEYDYDCEEIP
jgi:hypothetical protein